MVYSPWGRKESDMTERLTLLLHTLLCPQVSNQGQSLNTLGSAFLNIMWPHEIANGKWLLYPMRVELEGGQGPGQRGLCSPRPNILQLVRLRRGGWGR